MTKPFFPQTMRFPACLLALCLSIAATMQTCPAWAEDSLPPSDEIQLAEGTLSDETMAEMRAGFTDASGLIYRFAVDVRTEIDGAVSFSRQITLSPDASGQLQATTHVGLTASTLPQGGTATLINNGQGIQVTTATGTTTVLNQTLSGALASVIMNTANDQQITQTLNINLVLQNMPAVTMHGLSNQVTGLAQIGNMRQIGLGGY